MKKEVEIEKEKFIRWFSDLSNKDVAIAGGKGASLAEMFNNNFPVPPGFVITAQAFDFFISQNKLKEKIDFMIKSIDIENTESLNKISYEIRELIQKQDFPEEFKNEILEAYHILSYERIDSFGVSQDAINILRHSYEPAFVSVRSSATTEDLSNASFAGQQESYLNIKGDKKLLEHIKKCFSSLYLPRSIYYRHKRGFKESESLIAVVVQKMVDSQKSGVIFSKDPVNLTDDILIEAVFGLGEGIVSGKINPDSYIVSRNFEIKNIKVADKKIAIIRTSSGENEVVKLTKEKSKTQVLKNSEILELADYAIKLEKYYGKPQDIEFAIDTERIYIVQSRPITTLNERKKYEKEISGKILLEGIGSSPGIGVGVVKIIKDLGDLKKIKKGDVLVTDMTNPDMVVAMEKSVAIVTNEGGVTAHASIVSRELGIPCVVGTGNATSVLKEGMKVTVDGTTGKVYEGEVSETKLIEIQPIVETKRVKIKLILDIPESVDRALQSKASSVGLLRLEGIIASSKKHPLMYERTNNLKEYTEILSSGIEKVSKNFESVWIRTSDIRTDEFGDLDGAPEKELNPMLGLHGIRFSLKHPRIFEAELLAIKNIAEKYPEKEFGIMFPQVISLDEVKKAKEHFNKFKLKNMKFGIMVETPAAVQIIESICKEGIDFISFGTNDLTQFTLAVDRGEENVQFLYNEMHPAVLSQIRRVLWICKRYRVETSICGQAGSKKEMIEFLFKNGINSISVNADAAHESSKFVKELEEKREEFFRTHKDFRFFRRPFRKNYYFKKEIAPIYNNIDNIKNSENEKITKTEQKNSGFFGDGIEPIDNLEELRREEEIIEDRVKYEKMEELQKKEDVDKKIEVEEKVGKKSSESVREKLDEIKKEREKENIETFYEF